MEVTPLGHHGERAQKPVERGRRERPELALTPPLNTGGSLVLMGGWGSNGSKWTAIPTTVQVSL